MLKKLESYRGFPETEIYYDVVGFRTDKALDEEENVIWKVVVKIAMYSNVNETEPLEPPREYLLGSVSNPSLVTYDKVTQLTKQHPKFADMADA